jgi:NSS family neurotransmitter:Na+ symporter
MNFNEFTEFLYGQLFLPVSGLLIALFAGWFMLREHSRDEIAASPGIYASWRFLVRFVAVPAIAVILITGLM